MAITQNSNFNSYKISNITIDNFNVDNQFHSLIFEEGLFSPFIYGTLVLNKLTFVYPKDWKNKELGWINRKLNIEWETKLVNNKKIDSKNLNFRIYSIAEETDNFVVLLFIQKSAFNFYNLNFCDGWENTKISKIIKNIMNKVGIEDLKLEIDETETKISFTNPLIWTPIKSILYLLPMMKGIKNSKDYGYFFYSSSDNKINCKSINTFLMKIKENSNLEILTMIDKSEKSNENYGSTAIIGMMKDFKINNTNNILEELNNNIYGNTVKEYNIKTKEITNYKIKNTIKNNITNFGSESNLLSEFNEYDRTKFYFNNINSKETERNESIREFFNKNTMIATAYGLNSRNIGSGVRLILKNSSRYLEIENTEYTGKAIITKIQHVFDKEEYIQVLTLVKPGLNKYTTPTPLETL